jgi:hypothetical protein
MRQACAGFCIATRGAVRRRTRVLTTKSCAFVKSARVPTTGTCALLACAGSRSQNPRGVACAQDLLYRTVALSRMRRILMAEPAQ